MMKLLFVHLGNRKSRLSPFLLRFRRNPWNFAFSARNRPHHILQSKAFWKDSTKISLGDFPPEIWKKQKLWKFSLKISLFFWLFFVICWAKTKIYQFFSENFCDMLGKNVLALFLKVSLPRKSCKKKVKKRHFFKLFFSKIQHAFGQNLHELMGHPLVCLNLQLIRNKEFLMLVPKNHE